jgi:hypothetical protein
MILPSARLVWGGNEIGREAGMKRTLMRTVAVLVLGGMVLTGCGRAAKSSSGTAPSPAPASVPAVVVNPAPGSTAGGTGAAAGSGSGSVDNQLSNVDGLLSQIDGQVSADSNTPSDSD